MRDHKLRDGILLVVGKESIVIPFFLQETHPLVAWTPIIFLFICSVNVANLDVFLQLDVEQDHAFPLLDQHKGEVVFMEFREGN